MYTNMYIYIYMYIYIWTSSPAAAGSGSTVTALDHYGVESRVLLKTGPSKNK